MTTALKAALRPLVPPILYGMAQRMAARWLPGPGRPYSYSPRKSFAEAARESGDGYEAQGLLSKFVDSRTSLDQMSDFAGAFMASIAMASIRVDGRKIRVLDFGGASGYFRNYVDTFFDGKIKTDWWIVETKKQVDFNSSLNMNDVHYSASIDNLPCDIALFSGSLQFIEDWKRPLSQVNAELIFIARTPLGKFDKPFIQRVVREGRTFSYPGQVIGKSGLLSVLEQSHKMIACWKFDAHLLQMGIHESPAMLWLRR